MDRIHKAFAGNGETDGSRPNVFVSYLCAGDPDYETSLAAIRILAEEGAGVLEIGVPFSDPLADGKTNQLAAERALAAGTRASDIFRLVRELRQGGVTQPVVLYTYFNLVYRQGLETYVRSAVDAGIDALLVLDLPPEEGTECFAVCERHGMKTVLIVAPTTPPERLPLICNAATGFIYYVSREGVTGERSDEASGVDEAVAAIRQHTSLPIVVGFGISTPEQVAHTMEIADGAVVGSALVNALVQSHAAGEPDLVSFRARARALIRAKK